jgi:hypothetical protein
MLANFKHDDRTSDIFICRFTYYFLSLFYLSHHFIHPTSFNRKCEAFY